MNGTRPILRGKVRYDWWRAHHGLPQHSKWRSVARAANVPVSVVFHIAVCLLDLASRSNPRGSIDDFKAFDCAGIVDAPLADVERVLVVLRDIHWIEGHMLSEWDERQPQREDQGAAKRAAEYRARHASSHNVTPPMRDEANSHATEALRDKVSTNVTRVSAPDKDKEITTTFSGTAREDSENNNTAGLLATALPAGALAHPPSAEVVPIAPKPASKLNRSELDAVIFRKRLSMPMTCPCCVGWKSRLTAAVRKTA